MQSRHMAVTSGFSLVLQLFDYTQDIHIYSEYVLTFGCNCTTVLQNENACASMSELPQLEFLPHEMFIAQNNSSMRNKYQLQL